jgi:Uma2 family endonuclease
MDAVTATAQMSAAEFLAMPEDPNGRRSQLIDGELVMHEPTRMHNGSHGCVYAALRAWSREAAGRGWVGLPLDVELDERNVYAADVVWYAEDRAPQRHDPAPYPVPDIAVEVRSPSTWRFNIGVKKTNYERHGVRELWLVDTAADVVLVFRRSAADGPAFDVSLELTTADTLTSPLLPGFTLAVGEIFAG